MVPRTPRLTPPATTATTGARLVSSARILRPEQIPASPPPDVGRQVRAAQRALHELDERGREVRLDTRGGRIRIELCDAEGNVLHEVSPSEALDVAGWARWVE
jgi:hypothetical protein